MIGAVEDCVANFQVFNHDSIDLEINFESIEALTFTLAESIEGLGVLQSYSSLHEGRLYFLINSLAKDVDENDVLENGNCGSCRSDSGRTGQVCKHCILRRLVKEEIAKIENKTFLAVMERLVKFLKSLIGGFGMAHGVDQRGIRGSQEYPIRAFDVRRFMPELLKIEEEAGFFVEQASEAKKFGEAIASHWDSHQNLLGGHDEYRQCITTSRLQLDGEAMCDDNLVENGRTLGMKIDEHSASFSASLALLKASKSHLLYIMSIHDREKNCRETSLKKDDMSSASGTSADEACLICMETLEEERAVLRCGHQYHPSCLKKWFKKNPGPQRGKLRNVLCVLRCNVQQTMEDVYFLSPSECEPPSRPPLPAALPPPPPPPSHFPEEQTPRPEMTAVVGGRDFGSKITKVVEIVLSVQKEKEKIILMSIWDGTIKILERALKMNNVRAVCATSTKNLGDAIAAWKGDSSCSTLVLNTRRGAEGLTLTEANHLCLVDPLLNSSLDAQAISRIHRIGQSKTAQVHRLIVKHTVEEVLNAERIERGCQLEAGEVDAEDLTRAEVIGGGADSGFSVLELQRMFGLL